MIFENRQEAGKQLAQKLRKLVRDRPIILALPRGGVPVGYEIARLLHAPLEVIVVRKIGAPDNSEFGIGAIAEGGIKILDEPVVEFIGLSKKELNKLIKKEEKELRRRVAIYRDNKQLSDLSGRTVIIVDDGLATGITARAAISSVKQKKPKQIIFAAPVCAYETIQDLGLLKDKVICLVAPRDMVAIGLWYQNFDQLSDKQVKEMLDNPMIK